MIKIRSILGALSFLLFFHQPSKADTLLEYKASVNYLPYSEMGLRREYWLGEECSKAIDGPLETIIHHKRNVVLVVDNRAKTYIETELPFRAENILPDHFFKGSAKSGFTILVTDLDYREEDLYKWNCDTFKYELISTMIEADGMVCVAASIPGVDPKRFFDLHMTERFIHHFDNDAISELKKLEGILVAYEIDTEMNGQEIRLSLELQSVRDEQPPNGACAVPSGYDKKDLFDPAPGTP